ncbi:MAG: hypothetical protein WBG41_09770 [Acidimicrobiales bacterium]
MAGTGGADPGALLAELGGEVEGTEMRGLAEVDVVVLAELPALQAVIRAPATMRGATTIAGLTRDRRGCRIVLMVPTAAAHGVALARRHRRGTRYERLRQ